MARGRMINRKLATDQNFASLSLEAQWLFMRMLPFMDDHGRLSGNIFRLKCEVLPSVNKTDDKIINLLNEIQNAGLIVWQLEKTVQFLGFWKNQKIGHKPAQSEYPAIIKGEESSNESQNTPLKAKTPERSTSTTNIKYSEEFNDFWKEYPSSRRINKKKCFQLYKNAKKEISHKELVLSVKNHKKHLWVDTDEKFIPHLSTWLNDCRYEAVFKTSTGGERLTGVDCICTECGYAKKDHILAKQTEKCPKCKEYSFMSTFDFNMLKNTPKGKA